MSNARQTSTFDAGKQNDTRMHTVKLVRCSMSGLGLTSLTMPISSVSNDSVDC